MADDDQSNDEQEWAEATQEFSEENDVEVKTPDKKEEPKKEEKKPEVEKKPEGEEPEKKSEKSEDEKEAEAKKEAKEAADKKAKEEADKKKSDEERANETPEQKAEREKKEADDAKKVEDDKKEGEEEAPTISPQEQAIRETRATQQEMAAEKKSMISDVKEKMFSDIKTEITDADGDPIRTIEDVKRLLNPNTGKPFTETEAATYLLQAQQKLRKDLDETEKQIEDIAEVNLSIRDQANNTREKYGPLFEAFKKSPNSDLNTLQQRLWAEYQETLVKDEKTGIITRAPVSLERFYDTSLAGYVKLADQLKADEEAKEKAAAKKKEAEKKAKDEAKAKNKGDREDIFSAGKTDSMDPDEKEWAQAGKDYYENN